MSLFGSTEEGRAAALGRLRVAIVGAGAMGGYFAGRIAERGGAVQLIDIDADRLAAIARDGLRIEDDAGDRRVPVPACAAAAAAGPIDLVVVFTKSQHTAAAIASVRRLIGPATWALTLQNGLGNPEAIAAVLPADRIAMGVTDIPADLAGPTHIRSHGEGGVRFWSMDGAPAPGLQDIRDLLLAAGFTCVADPGIKVAIWEKAAFNAALNALAGLTRRPVGGLDTADGRALIAAVVDEATAAAAAGGIAIDRARVLGRIDHALAHHHDHQPSMLQDLLAGRRTEVEAINGAIVRAAEAAGLAAPINRTLLQLVRLAEQAPAR
jgi:2-dehydropantoate 2-reductase